LAIEALEKRQCLHQKNGLMAEGDRAAADLAWAKEIACIAVEKLTSKRLLKPEEAVVAIEIVAEEIFVRLILGHRPWR
jgi:hypothetical protein